MLSLSSASLSYAGAMPAMPVVQRAAAPSMGLSWTTPGEGAVWDPLGITKDAAKFEKFRYAEVKHGRVAMLAVVGHITAASGARFGGELANGVKFTSIEGTGYKALSQVRAETCNTRVRTCSQLPSEALSAVPRRAAVVS